MTPTTLGETDFTARRGMHSRAHGRVCEARSHTAAATMGDGMHGEDSGQQTRLAICRRERESDTNNTRRNQSGTEAGAIEPFQPEIHVLQTLTIKLIFAKHIHANLPYCI